MKKLKLRILKEIVQSWYDLSKGGREKLYLEDCVLEFRESVDLKCIVYCIIFESPTRVNVIYIDKQTYKTTTKFQTLQRLREIIRQAKDRI